MAENEKSTKDMLNRLKTIALQAASGGTIPRDVREEANEIAEQIDKSIAKDSLFNRDLLRKSVEGLLPKVLILQKTTGLNESDQIVLLSLMRELKNAFVTQLTTEYSQNKTLLEQFKKGVKEFEAQAPSATRQLGK